MAKPSELVVLSSEPHFLALYQFLIEANLALGIVHCQSLEALKATGINPLIVLLLASENVDYTCLLQEYPQAAFVLLQESYDEADVKAYIEACNGQYLHKNQINLLPTMLKSIVQWRSHLNERDNKIQTQQAALVSLAISPAISSGDWETALHEICSVTSKTLQVSRVSVWLYDRFRTKIECQMLYQLDANSFESGIALAAQDYPNYFAALKQNRVIVAPNARTNLETAEFAESYLAPLNIYSMLDAPIRVSGDCLGVVCFEHQHENRYWTIDDEVFGGAAADLVALVIEGLEHRRIEEAIKQTEKLQSLGLLASGIAHDFNNLLTVILSQSSLMADLLEKEHPAYKALHRIVSTTRQASALTRQLLTYAGNKPVQITGLSLQSFIAEHQDFLRLAVPPHIDLKIDDPQNLGIEADATQVQQVLMNLVINAAEAMANEAGRVEIEFAAESLQESFAKPHCYKSEGFTAGDYVRLSVRDTGQGIDETMLKRIFEPFFSTKSSGRGVGLATVLGVIRSHNGAMWVESSLGTGTSFHLYFKRASLNILEKVSTAAIPSVTTRTILVVDDAPEIVESISEILEINGLNTISAYNGIEAVDIYREDSEKIDLILVDMSMPGMNGAEIFEQLRKIKADAKVIVLSGYTDRELLRQFPNERPAALLAKPYDVNTLLETVWRYLA